MMKTLPQTPDALREELLAIFPGYRERVSPVEDGSTFHSVLVDFVPYFGGELTSFTPPQLRSFGALASAAVQAGGTLENAFGTVVLEHLHQIHASKALRPYLSKRARAATHA